MIHSDLKYLAPCNLEEIPIYTDWKPQVEQHLDANDINDPIKINVLEGNIEHTGCTRGSSSFAKLLSLVSRDEINSLLTLAQKKNTEFKTDPDSVDGMSTHEIYIDISNSSDELGKKINHIINSRITPYVRYRYPKTHDRLCTPSHCLIRRYRNDERKVQW